MADEIRDANKSDLIARRKGLQDKADDPKTDEKTARNARRQIGIIKQELADRTSGKRPKGPKQ
jgi:hypothetical protein